MTAITSNVLDAHKPGSARLFVFIWAVLIFITFVEIFLAYERLPIAIMVTALMGLSLIKAAMILSYFMHLRLERLGLFLTLIPALVFCVCLMLIMFFPDSVRLIHMRPQ